jgi:hypothetical protein
MAIDFPNSPTTNQLYTVGSRSWKWDGDTWNIYAATPAIYVQDSAPTSPINGDQWYESDTGRWFLRYQSVWVEIGNATDIAEALQPSQVTALSAVTSLTSDDVFPVVDSPASATASSKITYGNLVTNMSSSLAPGLVLITSGITTNAGNSVSNGVVTVGSAVSSIEVNGAFSSNYDSYKIIYTGGNASTGMNIRMRMGATTTNYYSSLIYNSFASSTPTGVTQNNTVTFWEWAGAADTTSNFADITLLSPFIAERTRMISNWSPNDAAGYSSNILLDTTSYTSFTFLPGVTANTFTGGTIRVYGYRN